MSDKTKKRKRASETAEEQAAESPPEETSEVGVREAAVSDIAELKEADQPERPQLSNKEVLRVMESLLFVADNPVTAAQLGRALKIHAAEIREIIPDLMKRYRNRGIELVEVGGGYQFRSSPACADWVREFVAQRPVRLTRAQLETLALVAYRQPITRPEIDEVRGVDTGSAVRVLLERGLIKMLGRKDEPGRPLLYGTTPFFLEFFGMKSMKDLPTLREFADLTEENRELFRRKTGETLEEAEAALEAAEAKDRAREDAEAEAEVEAELSAGQLAEDEEGDLDGEQEADDDVEGDDDAGEQASA